jgi:hypothetical protein
MRSMRDKLHELLLPLPTTGGVLACCRHPAGGEALAQERNNHSPIRLTIMPCQRDAGSTLNLYHDAGARRGLRNGTISNSSTLPLSDALLHLMEERPFLGLRLCRVRKIVEAKKTLAGNSKNDLSDCAI